MDWGEFCDLLAGLSPDTPLGQTVAIRSERDPEVLKGFSAEQHRIRNRWLSRQAAEKTQEQTEDFIRQIQAAFAAMCGGEDG